MQKDIALALYDIGAIKFGSFTTKAGLQTPIYIDLRILISFPEVLQKVADTMIAISEKLEFKRIAGIPYTALPIATAISLKKGWPMVYARKEVKDYGTKKKLEGVYQEGETCLIIDDLITTGGSKFETIAPFEEAGLKVTDVVVLVDREQGGARLLEEKNYKLHSVIGINEILDTLHEAGKIEPAQYEECKTYIARNQV
jgi:orotate phosphoribosyltransferase